MLSSNFTQQRVCIVGDGSLFDEGITQLLTNKTNLQVSRAKYPDDLAFLNIIKSDQPGVILICESGLMETARVLDLLSSHPKVMSLRIIVIRLNTTLIDIYARPSFVAGKISSRPRRIIVRREDDLIKAVTRKYNGQWESRTRI